jgi:hypothetical protein
MNILWPRSDRLDQVRIYETLQRRQCEYLPSEEIHGQYETAVARRQTVTLYTLPSYVLACTRLPYFPPIIRWCFHDLCCRHDDKHGERQAEPA